ncbi:MFS family permease [Chitinivorax tropicus]|uniref:Multidrug efflux pump Tap n=1 Tax=Chitinivorax tropicus TaxID=714531 RepID=A0A840MFR9_9PROT|nr:MFS transporter [Chitinivorax tropicus]MBB5017508.1 MFS family permease [Chitinivorax tropicus]
MLESIRQSLRDTGRHFALFILFDLLMLISLMAGKVGLSWWIASHGGAKDLALYGASFSIVILVLTPLLSPFADRLDKRKVLALAMLIKAMAVGMLALAALLHFYHIYLIIGIELIGAVCMALIVPASLSVVADVVPPGHLQQAFAMQKSAQAFGRTIGPALGGVSLAVAGEGAALLFALAGALIASLVVFRIPPMPRKAAGKPSLQQWWHEFKQGILVRWRIPMERYWTSLSFLYIIFFAPTTGMLVPLLVKHHGLSGGWLGVVEMGLSIGMMLGPLVVARRLNARFGRFHVNLLAIAGEAVGVILAGLLKQPILLSICFALVGISLSCFVLNGQTHRMLAVPENFRGRLMAVNLAIYESGSAIGATLAGVALLALPVDQLFVVYGTIMGVMISGYMVLPGFKHFLSLSHDEVKDYYQRTYPSAFELK